MFCNVANFRPFDQDSVVGIAEADLSIIAANVGLGADRRVGCGCIFQRPNRLTRPSNPIDRVVRLPRSLGWDGLGAF